MQRSPANFKKMCVVILVFVLASTLYGGSVCLDDSSVVDGKISEKADDGVIVQTADGAESISCGEHRGSNAKTQNACSYGYVRKSKLDLDAGAMSSREIHIAHFVNNKTRDERFYYHNRIQNENNSQVGVHPEKRRSKEMFTIIRTGLTRK